MKLRFRQNSLRLRVNQREVRTLASGDALSEDVHFPRSSSLTYILQPVPANSFQAAFAGGIISVLVPRQLINDWAGSEDIGIYFDLPGDNGMLHVAIEKDLECTDASQGDYDPDAFARA